MNDLRVTRAAAKSRLNRLRLAGLTLTTSTPSRQEMHAHALTDAGCAALLSLGEALPTPTRKSPTPRLSVTESRAAVLRILRIKPSTPKEVAMLLDCAKQTAIRKVLFAEKQGHVTLSRRGNTAAVSLYRLTPMGQSLLRRHDGVDVLTDKEEQTVLCLAEEEPIDTVAKMVEEYPLTDSAARERFNACVGKGLAVRVQDTSLQGRPVTYQLTELGWDAAESLGAVRRRGAA